MGTKNNPGKYDCYANALPDEPMFVLLARDPDFERLVNLWADRREADVRCGNRPPSDMALVQEARMCAIKGAGWRFDNNGRWRSPQHIDVVFDAPPGPQGGRFIEVEDATGRSICAGEWFKRLDGNWALRISISTRAK
jgi:hypothetical protein